MTGDDCRRVTESEVKGRDCLNDYLRCGESDQSSKIIRVLRALFLRFLFRHFRCFPLCRRDFVANSFPTDFDATHRHSESLDAPDCDLKEIVAKDYDGLTD